MLDLTQLLLTAGDGGHGRVSFRREKYIPKGGPDGGNGGAGGSVFLIGNKGLSTLGHLSGVKEIKAKNGQDGGARKKIGSDAEDVYVEVPVGTIVWLVAENQESYRGRMRSVQHEGSRQYLPKMEQYWLEGGRGLIPSRGEDKLTAVSTYSQEELVTLPVPGETGSRTLLSSLQSLPSDASAQASSVAGFELIEITQDGQSVEICQGGKGGRGNVSFAGPSNTTPWEAEYGQLGEKKKVILELRLLADVGLVGFPNAGKSTFLSKITRANPKIANYPFTTLEPNLGIWLLSEGSAVTTAQPSDDQRKKEVVVADIPGLIEGASQGKGLGLKFLRHIERCQLLLFLLSLDETLVHDPSLDDSAKANKLWQDYQTLLEELKTYDPKLLAKPRQIVINKLDLYSPELQAAIAAYFEHQKLEVQFMSAATGVGIPDLKKTLSSESVFQ